MGKYNDEVNAIRKRMPWKSKMVYNDYYKMFMRASREGNKYEQMVVYRDGRYYLEPVWMDEWWFFDIYETDVQ